MKLGLGQINMLWENKIQNMVICTHMIEKAKMRGVDFIVFPEMTLTGFSMNIRLAEERKNSETLSFFQEQASKNHLAVSFCMAEKEDGKVYNTCFILDSEGEVLTAYRKTHLYALDGEDKRFTAGNHLSFCEIKDFTVSPLICYELRFPELFQLCSERSDLIIVPANWAAPDRGHWMTLLKARAIENQCYVAGVNRFGEGNWVNFSGDSAIVKPDGEMATQPLMCDGLLIADIDKAIVDKCRFEFPLKADRRSDFYSRLYQRD